MLPGHVQELMLEKGKGGWDVGASVDDLAGAFLVRDGHAIR